MQESYKSRTMCKQRINMIKQKISILWFGFGRWVKDEMNMKNQEQMKKVSFKNQCILNVKKYCECWIGDEKTWHGSVNVDAF